MKTRIPHAAPLPNLRSLNAVPYMLRLIRFVAVPGPPAVMVKTWVYCLNHHTLSRIITVVRMGFREGRVM